MKYGLYRLYNRFERTVYEVDTELTVLEDAVLMIESLADNLPMNATTQLEEIVRQTKEQVKLKEKS